MNKYVPLSPQVRCEILEDWRAAKAPFGEPYERWVEYTSERHGIPTSKVKSIIAQEAEAFLFQVRQNVNTEAKQVALLAGATVSRAYEVLVEAMNASRKRYLRRRDGKPLIDEETGEQAYVEEPLIGERLRAAEMVIKVNGAFAAQNEVDQGKGKVIDVSAEERLTPAQIKEKFEQLHDVVNKLERDYKQSGPRITSPKPGSSGRQRGQGPFLLDDNCDEDEGRTG